MEDIVLETIMFQRPPEWGRRVIRRGDEVLLQTTDDGGVTWIDAPIPEMKLIIPASPKTLKSTSTDTNKYSEISFYLRESAAAQKTKTSIPTNTQIDPVSFKPEILDAINSGNLLTFKEEEKEGQNIETVTFLGVYSFVGLYSGSIWRDSKNYLRIVP